MLLQGSEGEHVGFSREMRLQTLSVSQLLALNMLLHGSESEHVGFSREIRLQTLFIQSVSQSVSCSI